MPENIAPNPSFETSTEGWTATPNQDWYTAHVADEPPYRYIAPNPTPNWYASATTITELDRRYDADVCVLGPSVPDEWVRPYKARRAEILAAAAAEANPDSPEDSPPYPYWYTATSPGPNRYATDGDIASLDRAFSADVRLFVNGANDTPEHVLRRLDGWVRAYNDRRHEIRKAAL